MTVPEIHVIICETYTRAGSQKLSEIVKTRFDRNSDIVIGWSLSRSASTVNKKLNCK